MSLLVFKVLCICKYGWAVYGYLVGYSLLYHGTLSQHFAHQNIKIQGSLNNYVPHPYV